MRKVLLCFGWGSSFMAGVSLTLGSFGHIGLVETLVFVITFVGLHLLILWELQYTPD